MNTHPFESAAHIYDRLNDIMSLRLHRVWKRRLVRRLIEASSARPQARTLDVSCGTGDVTRLLSEAIQPPVTGLDPSPAMLARAQARGTGRAGLVLGVCETLPFRDGSINRLSCAFGVRNFSDRSAAFKEWFRVLAPGGAAAVLEAHPTTSALWGGLIRLYWRLVPFLGRAFGCRDAYLYLRDSVLGFIPAEAMADEARDAGFELISMENLLGGGTVTLTTFLRP